MLWRMHYHSWNGNYWLVRLNSLSGLYSHVLCESLRHFSVGQSVGWSRSSIKQVLRAAAPARLAYVVLHHSWLPWIRPGSSLNQTYTVIDSVAKKKKKGKKRSPNKYLWIERRTDRPTNKFCDKIMKPLPNQSSWLSKVSWCQEPRLVFYNVETWHLRN